MLDIAWLIPGTEVSKTYRNAFTMGALEDLGFRTLLPPWRGGASKCCDAETTA